MNTPELHSLTAEDILNLSRGVPVALEIDGKALSLVPPVKPVGRKFASLADLSTAVMATRKVTMEVQPDLFVEFSIRALDSEMGKLCDDIGKEIVPPKKQKVGARGVISEELDWENPEFQAARSVVNSKRTAFVLVNGLVDMPIPGANLEEQSAALRKLLPPRVVNGLYSAITGLTSDPITVADFS